MPEKHIVRFWKGKRESYELLKEILMLDSWTRYTVTDSDGSITEYFGENQITQPSGQLFPVNDIVRELPQDLHPGERYLVGHDGEGGAPAKYSIVVVSAVRDEEDPDRYKIDTQVEDFDYKYGVRVISRGLKNYVLVDEKLKTYDDVDCGTFE